MYNTYEQRESPDFVTLCLKRYRSGTKRGGLVVTGSIKALHNPLQREGRAVFLVKKSLYYMSRIQYCTILEKSINQIKHYGVTLPLPYVYRLCNTLEIPNITCYNLPHIYRGFFEVR